jgi:hypothetical protein
MAKACQHRKFISLFYKIVESHLTSISNRCSRDLSVKNLKYLNSQQALADLANFRQYIHARFNLTETNKWISFGGSYAGISVLFPI